MTDGNIDTGIIVGRLGAPYGILGWIWCHSFTEDPESCFNYKPWWIANRNQALRVLSYKPRGKAWIVKIEGIESKEQAKSLQGSYIHVDKDVLPKLPDGEYYWNDLIGCNVYNTKGEFLGVVNNMTATNANDILVVKTQDQQKLLPFVVPEIVKQVDIKNKKIILLWDLEKE